tara:strand:- start:240 stop:512 length:273 start_codon:yes stop_codon:yes gene_type:complete
MPITQKIFELNGMILDVTFLDEYTPSCIDEPESGVEVLTLYAVDKNTDQEIDASLVDINEVLDYYDALKKTTLTEYDLGCIDDEDHPFYV